MHWGLTSHPRDNSENAWLRSQISNLYAGISMRNFCIVTKGPICHRKQNYNFDGVKDSMNKRSKSGWCAFFKQGNRRRREKNRFLHQLPKN